MHNCIIFSKDASLIGSLVMHRHELHYSYDISHLIEYAEMSHPDAIIVDTAMSPVSREDIERLYKYQCHIIIRADGVTAPSDEAGRFVHIFPTAMPDEEFILEIQKINNPESIEDISKKPILIIEDNDDIREMYVLSFKSKWYPVYDANDGLAWVTKACEIKPGVIILDIMMPHMDGFEVLHTLKHNSSIRPTIIVNSNLEWVDEEKKVKEMGADYFLRKSQYTPLEVVAFIESTVFKM